MIHRLSYSILVTFTICSALPVFAKNDTNTPPTPQTTKKPVYQLNPFVIYGQEYRTTASKSRLKPLDSPVSFEIYNKELFDQRQAKSVTEALRYVSGVTTESRGFVNIFDQYTIRGFNTYHTYYNGLPLQANKSWNLYPQIDNFAVQSIEILKGPTSVLYGSAPAGGMVNQTAKQPSTHRLTSVQSKMGTQNFYEISLDTKGPLTDDINYRFLTLFRQKKGQQQTTQESRYIIAPSITWFISDRTSLNINLYYQNDPDLIPSTPLPAIGTLYDAPYGKLDSNAYSGDENWAKFKREETLIGYKFEHNFTDAFSFSQNARLTKASSTQHNTYISNFNSYNNTTFDRTAYYTEEKLKGVVIDSQFSYTLKQGSITHHFIAGFDYQKLTSDIDYGENNASIPSINLKTPNYSVIDPKTMSFTKYLYHINSKQKGVYLQDELIWNKLTLLAGVRKDKYTSVDTFNPVQNIDQTATSMRFAGMYKLNSGLSPYLSYSESFEPLSGIDDNTKKAFKPITAKQIETGIKFKKPKWGTQFIFTFFDIKKKNMVTSKPSQSVSKKTQNGEVRSSGIEFSIKKSFNKQFNITATLTNMNTRVTKNPNNIALIGTTPLFLAEKQASIWAEVYVTDKFTLSGGFRHIGKRQQDKLNTATIPGITIVDLSAFYQLQKDISVGLTVHNAANLKYVNSCWEQNCWMGAERNIQLNIKANF